VGISDEARKAASRPRSPASRRLRRSKLVAAFAVTALVGIGSYAATYHALEIIDARPTAPGSSIGTVTSVPGHDATSPSKATETSVHPLPSRGGPSDH
jgi:hypothetical protein